MLNAILNEKSYLRNGHNPEMARGAERPLEPTTEATTTAGLRIAAVGGAVPQRSDRRSEAVAGGLCFCNVAVRLRYAFCYDRMPVLAMVSSFL